VTAQTPDFAAIIAEALHQQTHTEWPEEIGPTTEGCDEEEGWVDAAYLLYGEAANVMLAAPIAALCPDCKGTGVVGHDGMPDMECHHQNAPTIGGALTEWADAHQRAATNGHTIEQAMKVYEAVMGWDEDDLDVTVAEQRLIDALRKVAR
jgi:hypothetical protein